MRRQPRSGVVLFVVTVVIAMASLAAYNFLLTMQGENKASRTAADQLQVAQVAASGEEFIAAWLQAPRAKRRGLAELYGDTIFCQTVTEPTIDTESVPAGTFHIVVPASPAFPSGLGPEALDCNTPAGAQPRSPSIDSSPPFRYGVRDESTKLHLQTVLAWEERWPGAGRHALLQLPSMTIAIADAILDWIDEDDAPRAFGVENDYYGSLNPPVTPRNAIPTSLEELLQIRGVTPSLLFGTPVDESIHNNKPGAIDGLVSSDVQPGSAFFAADSVGSQPWVDFLTVHSAERNVAFDGAPRVYLNQSDLRELHRDLRIHFPQDVADFVILYRQYGPHESAEANNEVKTQPRTNRAIDWNDPATHQIDSVAELIGAVVRRPAVVSGVDQEGVKGLQESGSQWVASPFVSFGNQELDVWLDRLTIHRRRSIMGRLNILGAHPIVVAGLPVSDPSIVTQFLAARETRTWEQAAVPGFSWLLTDGILAREEFLRLSEFLTAGGDVVGFQVVATHPLGSLVNRFEVILDGTVEHTQRVYFRDLRRESVAGLFDMFYLSFEAGAPSALPGIVQVR